MGNSPSYTWRGFVKLVEWVVEVVVGDWGMDQALMSCRSLDNGFQISSCDMVWKSSKFVI